jgi:cation:H+ antiporter
MDLIFLALGLILLIAGANLLVKGASKISEQLGISSLIIGLTVVAFGTSAPELAVSVNSVISNQPEIAIGNVVGSNIFNVLFILGLSALITPLIVSKQLIRLDVPLMIGFSVLVWIMALNGVLSRLEGIALVIIFISYVVFLIYQGRKDHISPEPDSKAPENKWFINILFIVVGLILLVAGSNWLVESAVSIAQKFGVSELVIGLTIIAAGTSMPEVVTSVVASIKGERDIAVGNIVGSNIFNLVCILGITAIISPLGVEISESLLEFNLPVMAVVAFACLPIFFSENLIARWEGGLLFIYYIIYTIFIILMATGNIFLPLFKTSIFFFVIPLTVITILIVTIRQIQLKK